MVFMTDFYKLIVTLKTKDIPTSMRGDNWHECDYNDNEQATLHISKNSRLKNKCEFIQSEKSALELAKHLQSNIDKKIEILK